MKRREFMTTAAAAGAVAALPVPIVATVKPLQPEPYSVVFTVTFREGICFRDDTGEWLTIWPVTPETEQS